MSRVRFRLRRLLLLLPLLGACGGRDHPTPAEPAAQTFADFESGIRDTIGAVRRVTLRVTDADYHPTAGVTVRWVLNGSPEVAGRLSGETSVTDAGGRASITWQLGSVAAPQWLLAYINDRQAAQVLAIIDAGRAVQLRVSPEQVVLGRELDTTQVIVYAADRAGNEQLSYGTTWTAEDTTVATVGYIATTGSTFLVRARGRGATSMVGRLGSATTRLRVEVPSYGWITTGYERTCAADSAAALWCWGENSSAAIGDGTDATRTQPVPVFRGLHVVQAAMGRTHVCALTTDGSAYCAGLNVMGETGGGDAAGSHPLAVRVAGDLRFTRVSAGSDGACALTADGAAYCWGDNGGGELGRPDAPDQCVVTAMYTGPCARGPVSVAGDLRFSDLRAGPTTTACGVATTGDAYCWGGDVAGEAGSGAQAPICNASGFRCWNVPTRVTGGLTLRVVEPGYNHTCALTTEGRTYCWGAGYSDAAASRPVAFASQLAFVDLARAAEIGMCGLTASGAVWCWGSGNWGTGIGRAPRLLPGGAAYRSISVDRISEGILVCGPLVGGGTRCDLLPYLPD